MQESNNPLETKLMLIVDQLILLCYEHSGQDPGENNDAAFDEAIELSKRLIVLRATTSSGILAKIRAWKTLCTDDAIDPETASLDERLLVSAIDDIESYFSQSCESQNISRGLAQ